MAQLHALPTADVLEAVARAHAVAARCADINDLYGEAAQAAREVEVDAEHPAYADALLDLYNARQEG